MSYQPIENYGLIGDLQTAALVSVAGSIDFMCFPRFDSPTLFAALLDDKKGGRFSIAPAASEFAHRQRYFPDTSILLTRFVGSQGIAEVSDFMPVRHLGHPNSLVRRVKVVRGEIPLRMVCAPRFDYARAGHMVERRPDGAVFCPEFKHQPPVRLRSSVPVRIQNGDGVALFTLTTGQSASFILEEGGKPSRMEKAEYVTESFKDTMNFWLRWIGRSQYRGRWREAVNRSAITLKLLTSMPHGAIVAAPTFGLPAQIGGARNWDYRYAWIRDASFTLSALMRLGYTEEARAFMSWIDDRCREHASGSPLRVMYHIDGNSCLPEKELKHLDGYRASSPVRIGNAACEQLQLDIFGELMDAVHLYDEQGMPICYELWLDIVKLVEWVCRNWRKPDNSIWELRGGARCFLYSRVMCWVALDRALKIARRRSFPAPVGRWQRLRDQVYQCAYEEFWNRRLKAFVQFRGGRTVDAAALLLPLFNFISSDDPRWRSTLKVIEETLVEDTSVYRYRPGLSAPDGMPGTQGSFSASSFWYAECLALSGDVRKGRFIFEKALGCANDLGLFSEQLGASGEHLGNFPLALPHLGLISTAWALDQKLSSSELIPQAQR